jgi:hypothetical protein
MVMLSGGVGKAGRNDGGWKTIMAVLARAIDDDVLSWSSYGSSI